MIDILRAVALLTFVAAAFVLAATPLLSRPVEWLFDAACVTAAASFGVKLVLSLPSQRRGDAAHELDGTAPRTPRRAALSGTR